MNRPALAVASVAAAVVLTVALAGAGFAPARSAAVAASEPGAVASPAATTQIQTVDDPVYVAPAASPKVIHRTLPAPSQRIVTIPAAAAGSAEYEREAGEHDGGGEDD